MAVRETNDRLAMYLKCTLWIPVNFGAGSPKVLFQYSPEKYVMSQCLVIRVTEFSEFTLSVNSYPIPLMSNNPSLLYTEAAVNRAAVFRALIFQRHIFHPFTQIGSMPPSGGTSE
ncbi:hypothetical protein CEXT_656291 [Caerostris extrusa]|uniref:Uncharacterized protein n=1 Tax=Caerostris extrusa TaxID=172846 RepID=A0AAV4U185_CAEEX|nr:hypothetical protein CEXT_656291 [Caerostris extrusa]